MPTTLQIIWKLNVSLGNVPIVVGAVKTSLMPSQIKSESKVSRDFLFIQKD